MVASRPTSEGPTRSPGDNMSSPALHTTTHISSNIEFFVIYIVCVQDIAANKSNVFVSGHVHIDGYDCRRLCLYDLGVLNLSVCIRVYQYSTAGAISNKP